MLRTTLLLALAAAGCATTSPSSAQSVLSRAGPLPVRAEFDATSPRQLLLVSASAYTESGAVPLEVQVLVDGSVAGRCRLFSNGPMEHRALVCPAIPLSLAPGRHTLELRRGNRDTIDDPQDVYEATIVER